MPNPNTVTKPATYITSTICAPGGTKATNLLRVCLPNPVIVPVNQHGAALALASGSAMVTTPRPAQSSISVSPPNTSGSGGGNVEPSATQMEPTIWPCSF